MPYQTNADLPQNVRKHLPEHAQDIYREAFNNAWDEYDKPSERRDGKSRDETAYAVAWNAVGKRYKKDDNKQWVKKE